ncbi:MAG: acyltransferase domain-containing protein, partial [Myxococcales bacterium]|nr:acyltransferase domain-containing protein [Myxococcales bacterium]
AALHRTHFSTRAAVHVDGRGSAIEALRALSAGRPHAHMVVGEAQPRGSVVFAFPGQGSQWPHMGRLLLEESQAFARAVGACDEALRPLTGFSVLAVLRGDKAESGPGLERVDIVQPCLFTMGVGLAAAWRELGLEPSAVVGHSQGEVAAAVVAGALSLQDGARVVALRSRLLRRLVGRGGMAVVELPADVVEQRLAGFAPSLSIAVINTATSTVVSGDDDAIGAWVRRLSSEGVFCRRVDVDYASHSAQMDSILADLAEALASLSPRTCQVPMVSTVTGAPVEGSELGADYWCQNLRRTVRLDRALKHLRANGYGVFVEISAHPVLAMPLTAACADSGGIVVGSLRRDSGGRGDLQRGLAALHVQGHKVDWRAVVGEETYRLAALPTYAFQRQRYWLDCASVAPAASDQGLASAAHPLFKTVTPLPANGGLLFSGWLSLSEHPWLADHGVFGTVLLPGTCLLEMVLAAVRATGSAGVAELTLTTPLSLPESGGVRLLLHVDAPDAQGRRFLSLHGRSDQDEDQPWTAHVQGALAPDGVTSSVDPSLVAWPPANATRIEL